MDAVFIPTQDIPINKVLNAGNPDVFALINTNDQALFIKTLIDNLKLYMKTIIGTG